MFCALLGATFALIAPPTEWGAVVWIGLAGLACALDLDVERPAGVGARRAWFDGAGRGLAFGFGANVVLLRFIPQVIARFTPLPFAAGLVLLVLLALVQGAAWAVAGVVHGALVRARAPRPFAFALGVYASTFVPSIFPWTPAVGLTSWPVMLQLGEAVGERGVSALVALSAGLLAYAARAWWRPQERGRALAGLATALAIPLAMTVHGRARMRAVDALRGGAPTASIGLVDALVPATTRWEAAAAPSILASLAKETTLAEQHGAEVTIWPESGYPYVLSRGSKAGPPGQERPLQHGVRGPLLMGALSQDARGDRYNAAIAVRADGVLTSEYDKLHLLWFGEEVPLATELPWLRRTFARGLGLVPGERPVVLDLGRVKAGVLICFEDILPGAGREAASVSPNLLVNLSNDAWFAGSREPTMHLLAATMRAIETRRDFVRAVNVGPTSFIDASGRIREAYEAGIPASLVVKVALLDGAPTVYARFGDWPWIALLTAMATIFAATKANERRTTR